MQRTHTHCSTEKGRELLTCVETPFGFGWKTLESSWIPTRDEDQSETI
jgi:hypothetical protein